MDKRINTYFKYIIIIKIYYKNKIKYNNIIINYNF